jgi:hypothetical protein
MFHIMPGFLATADSGAFTCGTHPAGRVLPCLKMLKLDISQHIAVTYKADLTLGVTVPDQVMKY